MNRWQLATCSVDRTSLHRLNRLGSPRIIDHSDQLRTEDPRSRHQDSYFGLTIRGLQMKRKRLGQALVERKRISQELLEKVIKEQAAPGSRAGLLGEILLERGLVPRDELVAALEEVTLFRFPGPPLRHRREGGFGTCPARSRCPVLCFAHDSRRQPHYHCDGGTPESPHH